MKNNYMKHCFSVSWNFKSLDSTVSHRSSIYQQKDENSFIFHRIFKSSYITVKPA
jgi:hypothetical protein